MNRRISETGRAEFRVLGTAELTGPKGYELQSVLARPKLVALLSYLAASVPRGFVRRDTLIGLLWGDRDAERARSALRQTLHHLRKSLGKNVLLTRGDEEVGLGLDRFWCDVVAFEQALQADEPEKALELYRGELLEGFFVSDAADYEKWLHVRRSELRDKAAAAAWALAEQAYREGADAAAHWARRALGLAPLDEVLVRRVMQLLDSMGDRSGAVQEYEAFARRLEEELELDPAPETHALLQSIRERSTDAQPQSHQAPVTGGAETPAPGAGTKTAAQPTPRSISKTRAFRLGALAGAGAIMTLIAVLAVNSVNRSSDVAPDTLLDPRRVLVMPFENETGDAEFDQLGLMAADWIARGLEATGLVQTVPPEAVAQFAGMQISSQSEREDDRVLTLAEVTSAGTVITGAVYIAGDSLWMEALVTDATKQRAVANVMSPRASADEPTAAIEHMRQRVAGALATTLDGYIAEFTDAMRRPPTFEAYRAFVEAQELNDRGATAGGAHHYEEAQQLFLRAWELDTMLPAALVRAGWAAINAGSPSTAESLAHVAEPHRNRMTPLTEAQLDILLAETGGDWPAALRAARKTPQRPMDIAIRALWVNRPWEAVEILTENEWYPGMLRSAGLYGVEQDYWDFLAIGYHMLGQHTAELETVRRARESYPQSLRLVYAQERALAALGRIEELNELLDEGTGLTPEVARSPADVMAQAAFELRAHGHSEAVLPVAGRAIDWYESHPSDDSRDSRRRGAEARAYYGAERWQDARARYEGLATDFPDNITFQGILGAIAARMGDREEAMRISDRLPGLKDPYDFGRDTYLQACIAALLNEPERAMELLRASFAAGRKFGLSVHQDVDLQPLWDYASFQEFLKPKR